MKKSRFFVLLLLFLFTANVWATATPEILEKRIIAVSKVADKSVAFIKVKKQVSQRRVDPFYEFFRQFGNRQMPRQRQAPSVEGLGSGFVLDAKAGYVITNNHVISGADDIEITINGKTYQAKLIGTDPKTDIGLVQLLDFKPRDIKALKFANSDKIKVGSFAIAIGNPFGLSKSVTFGIISAKGRSGMHVSEYEDFIQTDAAINPGNSGGPLLNIKGEVIGMNTAIFSKSGGYMGIGFAVPSNMIKKITTALRSGKKIKRALLGVSIQDLRDGLKQQFHFPPREEGVLITSVAQASPAEKAGIRPGDIIVRFNKKQIKTVAALRNIVAFAAFDKKTPVELYRDGKKQTVWVNLQSSFKFAKEQEQPQKESVITQFGFHVEKRKGRVIVTKVEQNSLAHLAGLKKGDVLLSVNRKKISSLKQINSVLKNADSILLYVERDGRKSYLVINR